MPKKVLICDDERCVLEPVTYVVREEGYTVLTAEDGEEALRLARTELPDLMLLDISMPKKNGNEVCRELKSNPATRGIYILALTARAQEDEKQESLQCGFDKYETKPLRPSRLRKTLHELLD